MKKIFVLCGLTGSGKTKLANEMVSKSNSREIKIFNYKDYVRRNGINGALENIKKGVDDYERFMVNIIDGPFLTQPQYEEILDTFSPIRYDIEFHYFEPDVESCMWNNKYRTAIENIGIIKEPNMSKLPGSSLHRHVTNKKSYLQLFQDRYGVGDIISSNSWSLGGSWRDCWGGGGSVSASAQPTSFEEFDVIIEAICPNVTFMQYKKLSNTLTYTDQKSEGDYYGGSVEYATFKCDTNRLYKMLGEMGLLDDEFQGGLSS